MNSQNDYLLMQDDAPQPTDLFGFRAAATPDEIINALHPARLAFPNCEAEFWEMLADRMQAKRWCKERIAHVVNSAIESDSVAQSYRFNRLTTVDFLNQPTRQLKSYTREEAAGKDVVIITVNGRDLIVPREQAEFGLYPFRPFLAALEPQPNNTANRPDKDGRYKAVIVSRHLMPFILELRSRHYAPWVYDYAAAVLVKVVEPVMIPLMRKGEDVERYVEGWKRVIREDAANKKARYLAEWKSSKHADRELIKAYERAAV